MVENFPNLGKETYLRLMAEAEIPTFWPPDAKN